MWNRNEEWRYGNEVVWNGSMSEVVWIGSMLFGMGMRLCLEWKVWEWGY